MESARTSYAPPVDQLLTYGEGQNVAPEKWPNYLELGPGLEHVPELIRMAGDEELNRRVPASRRLGSAGPRLVRPVWNC